jgi:hypothetical protein
VKNGGVSIRVMRMLPYSIVVHLRYRRLEIGGDPAEPELLGWLFLLAEKHTLEGRSIAR